MANRFFCGRTFRAYLFSFKATRNAFLPILPGVVIGAVDSGYRGAVLALASPARTCDRLLMRAQLDFESVCHLISSHSTR